MTKFKKTITTIIMLLGLFIMPKTTIQAFGINSTQQEFFNLYSKKIYIDVKTQTLYLTTGYNSVISKYKISTERNGTGEKEGSYKTPRGIFEIHSKYGKGNNPMSKYKGKAYIGEYDKTYATHDNILSRIITLDGKESHNSNTLQRCVYIHGTSDTQRLGKKPCSMGCVRMCPYEIVEFFNKVEQGTPVYIHDSNNPLSWEKKTFIFIQKSQNPLFFNRKEKIQMA